MPSPSRKEDTGPPGAGTWYVYGRNELGERRIDKHSGVVFDELSREDAMMVTSPDAVLEKGIADYTFIPASAGGVLGKGKFSTVYKVTTTDGNIYALKHTPLHPHHPLISSRLLREPTLLAQLPPHPCLIGVDGWVRTEGHFYLIEQYATTHVALPLHPLPLSPTRAAYILDQLVSVVRDGLHNGGRVCHRDLKGENVLIDVDTGDILLLDLGLATHYSASQPRLTTCCGSPAFHSPEIVNALNHPPGAVTYYGPELDIWCIALTMLALLLQTRFPLGPTHTSRYVMKERVRDRLQELDELYPLNAPWRGGGRSKVADNDLDTDRREWARVRKAMLDFLEIDGVKRMASFAKYDVGDKVRARVSEHSLANKGRSFKTTSFIPAEVKYTLPIYLDIDTSPDPLILRNPTGESEKRVLSYIKYLLRSSGILYHCIPDMSPVIIQLVLPLAPSTSPSSSLEPLPSPLASRARPRSGDRERNPDPAPSLLSALFSLGKKSTTTNRSASVPPKPAVKAAPPTTGQKKGKEWATKCWIKIDFEGRKPSGEVVRRRSHKASSRASSKSRADPGQTILVHGEVLERLSSIVDNSPGQSPSRVREGDHPEQKVIAQTLKSLKINGTSAPIRPQQKRTVSRASSRLRSENHHAEGPLSPLSRQVSVEDEKNIPKKRPASQSRKPSYRTVNSHRQHSLPFLDTVLITSTEPRAYDLLRRAFNVKHEDSAISEAVPELQDSKLDMVHDNQSEKSETTLHIEDEERPRGRSKEVARSHESEKRLSSSSTNTKELEVKLSRAGVGDGPPSGEQGEKPRDVSRGRKGFLEGWFGKGGAYLEQDAVGGKATRSSSLPPFIVPEALLVNHM